MTPALLTIALVAVTSGTPSEVVSRAHFAKAQKAFAAHDWRHALDEFTAAGESSPSEVPDLWFDIGQCQRNLGHPRQAAAAFERYLSLKPDAPDRERVRGLVVALGGKPPPPPIEATALPVDEPAPAPVIAPTPVIAPAPAIVTPPVEPQPTAAALPLVPTSTEAPAAPPAKRHRHWKIWTGVAIGVAVVAVGVGLGVGLGTAGGGGSGSMAPSTPSLGSAATFDTRSH